MKKKVFDVLLAHGTFASPEAIENITSKEDPVAYINAYLSCLENYPLVITTGDLAEFCMKDDENHIPMDIGLTTTRRSTQKEIENEPKAAGVVDNEEPGSVVIIRDISEASKSSGEIENFANYIQDRYRSLARILKRRTEMVGTTSIERAKKLEGELRVVGMVAESSKTKNEHLIIQLEDDTAKIPVLVMKNSPLIDIQVINDEVIGVIGKVVQKREGTYRGRRAEPLMIAEDIVRPEMPVYNTPKRAKDDVAAAFISDIHVGSTHFLEKEWKRMVSWLGSNDERARRIKYAVIPGDVVDGIGIYPNQIEELEITDIFDQYRRLTELMEDIPDRIEIVMLPGNHDAVRPAEPQPAFSDTIKEMFTNKHIHFVSNPAYFTLEGVGVQAYHGKSIDDLVSGITRVSYDNPITAMEEMLKRRHMVPMYGGKTPIAPEPKDYLIIDRIPDIFVTGHVHGTGVGNYRGVTMICASAWQSQTPFQKMHNFNPDPAKVPVVNLRTGKIKIEDFN